MEMSGHEASAESFWRTLICNSTPQGQLAGPEYGSSHAAFRRAFNMVFSDESSNADWSSEDIRLVEDLCRECILFEEALGTRLGGREFAITSNRRTAMVPHTAEKGDILCMFLEAITPFVIRPDGNGNGKFYLVRECYVHGVLHGELLDLPYFESSVEEITLRESQCNILVDGVHSRVQDSSSDQCTRMESG